MTIDGGKGLVGEAEGGLISGDGGGSKFGEIFLPVVKIAKKLLGVGEVVFDGR